MNRTARRILIAAHSGSRGGAEYCLDTTLRHLDRARFDARVVFAWDGPLAERARAMGYPVEVQSLAWWMGYEPSLWHYRNATLGSAWRVFRLARRLRREAIDLVYTSTAVVFEAALAARLARVPHVWHVHEVLTPQFTRPRLLPLRRIVRWIGQWSRRVVFESEAARAVCRGLIAEEKMRTVYNSVRFEGTGETALTPDPSPASGRGEQTNAGPPPSPPAPLPLAGEGSSHGGPALRLAHPTLCAVVWIGRFSERKAPVLLVRAAARMQRAAECRFVFAGEGPLESELRRSIRAVGLDGLCRVLPFQEDVRPLLEESDVLVLTSREESFGLVLAEAAAFGVPAVATRTQGPAEIVADGRTGLLVEPGDEAALAAALDRLAADPALRRTLGCAAARRAAELFSPEKNTRKLETILEESI